MYNENITNKKCKCVFVKNELRLLKTLHNKRSKNLSRNETHTILISHTRLYILINFETYWYFKLIS